MNNDYIPEGTMTFSFLEDWWTDAGTFDSLVRAANLIASGRRNPLCDRGAIKGGQLA